MAGAHGDPRDRRFFFVHMQKTGGTALHVRLKACFDERSRYPNPTDGDMFRDLPQVSVPRLLERWAKRRDEIRLVFGHFPLCTAQLLGAEFVTLTLLREPVERTLSYLRHHRALTPDDRERSLEAIYEDEFRFHGFVHNHMVKMLALRADEMTDGMLTRVEFTNEHLDRAEAQLAGVDVVGLQERFDDFCGDLAERFGWRLGDPVHANRTEHVAVPASFRARIADDNALDVELFEYATRLVRDRGRLRART
jgi:hypothetical protein